MSIAALLLFCVIAGLAWQPVHRAQDPAARRGGAIAVGVSGTGLLLVVIGGIKLLLTAWAVLAIVVLVGVALLLLRRLGQAQVSRPRRSVL